MDYQKAYEISNTMKSIEGLERKIELAEDFINQTPHCEKGELKFTTFNNSIFSIRIDDKNEVREIADIILNYYKEKRNLLFNKIDEL